MQSHPLRRTRFGQYQASMYMFSMCRNVYCHEKFGPPHNGPPWSIYFEIFGPPELIFQNYTEISGPPLKLLVPLPGPYTVYFEIYGPPMN